MRALRDLWVRRMPLALRILLVAAFLAALAAGLAAPDDWGYSGWAPRGRP